MNIRQVLRRSIILRVAVPMFVGTLFTAVLLLRIVPERQHTAIESSIESELQSLAAAFAVSAQLAFAQQDLQALSSLNRLIADDQRGLQVAVFVDSSSGEELLAAFPATASVFDSRMADSAEFLTASSPFASEFDQGRVVVAYDKARLSEQMALINLPLYLALIALMVVQILIYRRLRSDVVIPIIKSAQVAEQLGAGDYNLLAGKSDRIDEVGLLLKALRALGTRLKLQRRQNNRLMTMLESEVDKRTIDLQRALEAKDTFMAGVSHELRTPLHSMIASLDLVASDGELSDVQTRNINLAKRGSRALMQLINELLDFQRLSQREIALRPEPQCIASVIDNVTEITAALFQDSELSFESDIQIPPNLWAIIDSHRFVQVFLNLLGNARKFTERGTVTLSVHAQLHATGTVDINCAVIDTGPGMDPTTLARLGEAFFQGEGGLARKHEGTGLGISICKRILAAMDSELTISSELSVGSEFGFRVRAKVVQASEQMVAQYQDESSNAQQSHSEVRPLSLLYIEDSEMNQMVMRALCERFPVDLVIADSAKTGFEQIQTRKFDVIITDIQMPEHSGLDFLSWYQRDAGKNSATPVFACTANATSEACEKFVAAGFADILTKPLTLSELHAFLARF